MLKAIYWNIRSIYSLLYVVFTNFITIVRLLKLTEALTIRPFKTFQWHDGFLYFIGALNDKKVFMKIDLFSGCQENEIIAHNILKPHMDRNLVPILGFERKGPSTIVIYEFINSFNQDVFSNHCDNKMLIEVLRIVETINNCGIIHRDLKEDNFLLAHDRSLKIIDFTFCADLTGHERFCKPEPGSAFELGVNTFLGGAYRDSDSPWNDFHALNLIFQKYQVSIESVYQLTGRKNFHKLTSLRSEYSYRG